MQYKARDLPNKSRRDKIHDKKMSYYLTDTRMTCKLLSDWAGDSRTLHFTFGVDNDPCVVFKI
jgi:hypothetical protein